jgi:hypothetical protein
MIDERPNRNGDPGDAWEREPWVRELDMLVRPTLVTEPPPDVQQSILAAVLLATAPQPVAIPGAMPAAAEPPRPVPLAAYVLLAAVLVAYVAGVSWLEGVFGNVTWVSIMVQQLVAVTEHAIGRPSTNEPMALVWNLFLRAPWIALLPVAWLLWDRDRTSAPVA